MIRPFPFVCLVLAAAPLAPVCSGQSVLSQNEISPSFAHTSPADLAISPSGAFGVGASTNDMLTVSMGTGAFVRRDSCFTQEGTVARCAATNRYGITIFTQNAAGVSHAYALIVDMTDPNASPLYILLNQNLFGAEVALDLDVSPNLRYLAVVTGTNLNVIDLSLPTPAVIVQRPAFSAGTFVPRDRVRMTNTCAVAVSTGGGGLVTTIDVSLPAFPVAQANLNGLPIDLEVSPDGSRAGVRTVNNLQVYQLPNLAQLWATGQDPLASTTMLSDAVEMTNTVAATLANDGTTGYHVTFLDFTGNVPGVTSFTMGRPGFPADIARTPDQRMIGARSWSVTGQAETSVWMRPAGGFGAAFMRADALALVPPIGFVAALDWLDMTNEDYVAVGYQANTGQVGIGSLLNASLPVDVYSDNGNFVADVSAGKDKHKAATGGQLRGQVFDLNAPAPAQTLTVALGYSGFTMVDLVETFADRALLLGSTGLPNNSRSWLYVIDLAPNTYQFATAAHLASPVNSVGSQAGISFTGSTSVVTGDLVLQVNKLPPNETGAFYVSTGMIAPVPLGNGISVLSPPAIKFLTQSWSGNPGAPQTISQPLFPVGTPLVSVMDGIPLYFQFIYRDGANIDTTQGLEVTFTQ